MVHHRLELKALKEGIQGASAALRHFWRKAASLTSAARCASVLPASLRDPHRCESLKVEGRKFCGNISTYLSSCGVDANKVVKVTLLGA